MSIEVEGFLYIDCSKVSFLEVECGRLEIIIEGVPVGWGESNYPSGVILEIYNKIVEQLELPLCGRGLIKIDPRVDEE